MVQKLEYLVSRSGRDTFHRLMDLRSDFWSFVEVPRESAPRLLDASIK
jgi:hypothetical protein